MSKFSKLQSNRLAFHSLELICLLLLVIWCFNVQQVVKSSKPKYQISNNCQCSNSRSSKVVFGISFLGIYLSFVICYLELKPRRFRRGGLNVRSSRFIFITDYVSVTSPTQFHPAARSCLSTAGAGRTLVTLRTSLCRELSQASYSRTPWEAWG